MIKRMIIMVILLIIVFGGIFGWKAYQSWQAEQQSAPPPPPTVATAEARTEIWQPRLSAVGSLSAVQGVSVSTEVAGMVSRIDFQSGEAVEEGNLLVQLDDTADRAQLRALKAQVELARINYERIQELIRTRAVSQSELDRSRSELENLRAQVDAQEALIAKKSIRAPFTGRLGIRQINLGQYISPGTDIVTLQSLDPIYVNFALPERFLSNVSVEQSVELTVAAFPEGNFQGTINAISPRIDVSTRNLPIQATLQNDDFRLRPGMFAEVDVLIPEQNKVITLPRTAITYAPYGDSVFAIEEQDGELTVQRRQVQTGGVRNNRVEIVEGLSEGERVVSAGQVKLRNGQRIQIDNSVELAERIVEP